MMTELEKIAEYLGGYVVELDSIRIDTGDRTSNENYDDLLDIESDIEHLTVDWQIIDRWADHDTQIITFGKVI